MSATVLHQPAAESVARSRLTAFRTWVAEATGTPIAGDRDLLEFSVREMDRFLDLMAQWAGMRMGAERYPVMAGDQVETAAFFPQATLSYVDHLLRPPGLTLAPEAVAVIAVDEL